MQAIHQKLQETLQVLYRKAIDADHMLDQLQKDQKGKFQSVFAKDSGFRTTSRRFTPYVEEITQDWEALKQMEENDAKAALPVLVKKIELALTTINQFQAVGRG